MPPLARLNEDVLTQMHRKVFYDSCRKYCTTENLGILKNNVRWHLNELIDCSEFVLWSIDLSISVVHDWLEM